MQIPETPSSVVELDLMKRLDAYANGSVSWNSDKSEIGTTARQACRTLHTNLTNLVNGLFAFILDRVTAREMETFTMHDRVHGRKVAHLMWHILKPERREQLTPPEIALMLLAAHLHDLGMGLSPAERAVRLGPESDLWDKLEVQDAVRVAIEKLRKQIGDIKVSDSVKRRAEQQLFQAEEALLTQDTRERHATKLRYEEILALLAEFHQKDPTKTPDIEASLSFDGDSIRDKLVDVCVSHNEDADALVGSDEKNLDRPRFPKDFPVGRCGADLHLVAAALRLADILDFDRERTPPHFSTICYQGHSVELRTGPFWNGANIWLFPIGILSVTQSSFGAGAKATSFIMRSCNFALILLRRLKPRMQPSALSERRIGPSIFRFR